MNFDIVRLQVVFKLGSERTLLTTEDSARRQMLRFDVTRHRRQVTSLRFTEQTLERDEGVSILS